MLRSQKNNPSELTGRTFTRRLAIFFLLAVSTLTMLAVSVSSRSAAAPDASGGGVRTERKNPRSRDSRPTAARAGIGNAMLLAPLASISVDRTDDAPAASACTAAANDCSLRGAVTFANLNPGTTINVPAGTYQLTIAGGAAEGFSGNNAVGDLDVLGNNTAIIGAGASVTIIRQTTANDRVIELNPFLDAGFNFTVSGVTITGGRETTGVGGGGIICGSINNTTSVSDSVISGNSATGAGTFGGGGISCAGGSLTISGTTFASNSTSASGGGLGYSAGDPLGRTPSSGTLTVSSSTFTANSAGSSAAGGGGVDLFDFNLSSGSYSITTSTFSNNTANNGSGGAIIVESGPLTVTRSSLSGNHAGNSGGAVYSSGSAEISFSRLVGNTATIPTKGNALFRSAGAFTGDNNWWGANTGPSANDFRTSTSGVTVLDYLELEGSASPDKLCPGQNSTLTADIKKRSFGPRLTVELNGLPAFPVPPAVIFNNAVLGTISGASTQFVDGVATATYTAGSTDGAGSADATADNQTITISLTVQSTSTSALTSQSVCQGATAIFSTTASGNGPFHYAWTLDGSTFDGNNASISIPTGSLSIGSHTVTVATSGACGTDTRSATLTVQENTATSDPADQAVCQGAAASFATTATGTGPFHYVWTLDGSPFDGDNPSINVPTGSLSVGSHAVTVTTSGVCGTASQSASLTVQAATATSDPADQTLCQGATAGFATTASGTGPFQYAWTVDGSAFDGDNPSISVPTGSLSIGNHTVTVTTTGACGSASQSASLTVQENTATSDPADQAVCQGATASFATSGTGAGPLHYAWTLDGSPFNGDSASISVPTGSLTLGSHTVVVTTSGVCGSASQSATLTVQENTATTDPADQTVCQGATAGFATTGTGAGPLHYAWTLDGSPFNGDSAIISVPTGSLSVGNHTVVVTTSGVCGSASQSATLTVQENTTTSDPGDQTVCQGATAGFATTASGTGTLHYAWTLDGSPFNGDSASISVPTGSLSLGSHTVVVTTTGVCGTVSQSATLTVQENTVTSDPGDQTVCQGATAAFATTASGTGPLQYAWTLDGSPFNGDSASINVPTGSLSVGNHTVTVTTTGACGSVSQSATLTVQENTATSDPADQTVCQGASASFATIGTGAGPLHYAWTLDGSPFNGDSASISVPTGSLSLGSHTVVVTTTGVCGSASQSATLTVQENTVTSDPGDQ
ncbi:MAG: hypothetical protein QOJ88_1735, partial [Pyrinomonadaceae bacterium]|nr:hypothetical protein [Pyrinomonadaceae bacterium]